jgi:hypothetical protein
MNAQVEQDIEWMLKASGSSGSAKRKSEQLLLMGARFTRDYLETTRVKTLEVSFAGELAQALEELRSAARAASGISGLALPTLRLRASLLARIPNVIALDRDLGQRRSGEPSRPAAVLFDTSAESGGGPGALIAQILTRWYHDVLDAWATRHKAEKPVRRVLEAAKSSNIHVVPVDRQLLHKGGSAPAPRSDLSLIVREVAERLIGEELFPGLGPVELVLEGGYRDPGRGNEIDLMTEPRHIARRDESFSMVASLSAVTVPYSEEVYLKVSAMKRVWACEPPAPKRNAPFGVRGYVMGPARPTVTVSVERRREGGWQFGEDYAEWLAIAQASGTADSAKDALPATLEEALRQRIPLEHGWWSGLPQLTTLFDSVAPHTVFEGDEYDLSEAVFARLPEIISPDIPFRSVPLRNARSSANVAMLRLSDLGLAGQALTETEEEAQSELLDEERAGSDSGEEAERRTLQRHREENQEALRRIHKGAKPALWAFYREERERHVIEKSVAQLFGDAVDLHMELLPEGTHGLRERLPGKDSKPSQRFDLRVKAWAEAAKVIKSTQAPRHVLICAPDREGAKPEDAVNYYAGIHAMCLADANVHHVLPIGGGDSERATQHFVHRLQSALLDVFLAHSGVVFGTEEFLRPLFSGNPPNYVYGVQAARSNARSYSGERNVSFLIFTRLHVKSGTTEVRFIYSEKGKTCETPWLPFSAGLRWLGSQRALEGNPAWLEASAAKEVRVRLGNIADEDPRALVLIDWSSMANLWRGIRDEDLTHGGGVPRIDGGKDISAACPKMTLVRLRRGGPSITLRTKTTTVYERSGQQAGFSGGGATGETYSDTYVTTTGRIIALSPTKIPPRDRPRGHYIQSMRYRKTTQTVRGQSCYRITQRMGRPDKELPTFRLRVLEPSHEDAALPAPLEVTVMSAPVDVNPDNVAIAVFGLRLGYVHYGDWTALPAPLFFKRKIDDYVIRYRSPTRSTVDDEPEEEELALTEGGTAEKEEAHEGAAEGAGEVGYLRETAQAVVASLGPTAAPAPAPSGILPAVADEEGTHQELTEIETEHEAPAPLSDADLAVLPGAVSDDQLLELVRRASRENILLGGSRAGFKRRMLYSDMLRGRIRVQVSVPSFVNSDGIFGNEPPTDREALRRFWDSQHEMLWVARNEQMPALQKLGAWVMRRLSLPQGGMSIYGYSLFPRSSLFALVRERWREYVLLQRAEITSQAEDLNEADTKLDPLTEWATQEKDDALLAWLIFGCAHFPAAGVLESVLPKLNPPFGPLTREALHYFLTCVRAVRAVLEPKPRNISLNNWYPRALANAVCATEAQNGVREVSSSQSDERPSTPAVVMAAPHAAALVSPDSGGEASSHPVAGSTAVAETESNHASATNDVAALLVRLHPGESEFESALAAIREGLETLEQEHQAILSARARTAKEAEKTRVREQSELQARYSDLSASREQLLTEMRTTLPDTERWAIQALPEAIPSANDLGGFAEALEAVRQRVAAAVTAQAEYKTVEERATPASTLTPRDQMRHRAQWQEALRTASETFETAFTALETQIREARWFGAVPEASEQRESEEAPIARETVLLGITSEAIHKGSPAFSGVSISAERIALAPADSTPIDRVEQTQQVPALAPEPAPEHSPSSSETGSPQVAAQGDEIPPSEEALPQVLSTPVEVRPSTEQELFDEASAAVALAPEVLAGREQAGTIRNLVQAKAFAVADVYLQALRLNAVAGAATDHELLIGAALDAVRRLRSEVPQGGEVYGAKLRERLEGEGLTLPDCEALGAALGVLSAGIGEMLFPQIEGSGRWTFIEYLRPRLAQFSELGNLIERVSSLEGFNFSREMLVAASIGARTEAQSQLAHMRERARRWAQDESLYKNWMAGDYKQLHEALFKDQQFPIARCLAVIANGEDQKLDAAYHDARKKLESPLPTIEELGKRLGRRRSFDGVARRQIQDNLHRTHQFIKEYLEAVNRAKGIQAPVTAKERAVLQALYQDLIGAVSYLEELAFENPRSALHRELACRALNEVKCIFDGAEHQRPIKDDEQLLLLRLPLGSDLRPSISAQTDGASNTIPPVVDPVEVIGEIENLTARMAEMQDGIDSKWVQRELDSALEDHLAHIRLLPARRIERLLGRGSGTRVNEQKQAAKTLSDDLQRERQRVTNAVALGSLTQSEAARMLRLIEELLQGVRVLGDPDAATRAVPDFPHAYAAVRRLVTQPLNERLKESTRKFLDSLDKYQAENPSSPQLQSDIERIRAIANEGSASSLRVAADMFSLLKDGALPKKVPGRFTSVAQGYKEFVDHLKRDVNTHQLTIESLAERLGEKPQDGDPAWLAPLDERDRSEAIAFLKNWAALCAGRTREEIERPLNEFLRGLKPLEPSIVVQTQAGRLRTEFQFETSPFLSLDRSITQVFIPPALGSSATLIQGIVVRNKASEAQLRQAIDECAQTIPTFLLARGNLSLETRAVLSRHTPVLLIDDDLVAYAAVQREERLAKLMQVALLTFNGNPYDDYGRPVPPEMFFGRRKELASLRQVKTAAVLFGGRRLGKSSLLDQLERDAQLRKNESVLYLTLNRADHSLSDDPEFLAWRAILHRLIRAKVLAAPKREPAKANEIPRYIEDEILSSRAKTKAIYLLIDEADDLMERDLTRRSEFLARLMHLAETVKEKCKFRFVVAGLHNLTRMASDANSPLGKFDSIALKPFWAQEDVQRGIDLIRVPLEALGFHFEPGQEDMPLRIMAVCNFYPAFIQLYCKKLADRLYNRRDRQEPPTYITAKDLEAVEQDKDFLSDIRAKFRLNLELDKRYAAIALILADQYYREGASALTASEVRDICQIAAPRHFETTGSGAYEALLDEMEILTILERSGGRYSLRTPNIAMMLGDKDSVTQQLEALSVEKPVRQRSRGEARSLLTPMRQGSHEQCVFPMPSAWMRGILATPEGDGKGAPLEKALLVLVGNDRSGLAETNKLKGQWQLADAAVLEVAQYLSAQAARSALVRGVRVGAPRSMRRLHLVASGSWKLSDLPEYARLATTLASSAATGNSDVPVVRVGLIASTGRAYELARQLTERQFTDATGWQAVPVPPWDDDALYYRLEQLERPYLCNDEEARKALLAASGGFGSEIERLCAGTRSVETALRAREDGERHLAPDLESFYRQLNMPAAITAEELKSLEDLLRAIHGESRQSERLEEYRQASNVTSALLMFAQWMGLLQEAQGGTWEVPEIYRRLLK